MRQIVLAMFTLAICLACSSDHKLLQFEELESRYVEVKGAKIHYKEMGEGDPILFVHGNLTNAYLWREVMPRMAQYGRCIAIDLVGMGNSDRPAIAYNILDHNDYFFEFINKLDLKNITLVGNEWGATLCMNYFAMADHNVKGLVMMEPVIGGTTTEELMASDKPLLRQYAALRKDSELDKKSLDGDFMLGEILPQFTAKALSSEARTAYREPFANSTSKMPLLGLFEAIPVDAKPRSTLIYLASLRGPLYGVNKPKLLIRSDDSFYLNPAGLDYMKSRMKGLNITSVGKAGILISEDQPTRVAEAIEQWYLKHF